MEPRDDQQPYLDLEHFPSARMVDREARRNLSGFLLEVPTAKPVPSKNSSKALQCQPVDLHLLGEHPPLEGLHL